MCDNLGTGGKKSKIEKMLKKKMMVKCLQTSDKRSKIFDNVQICSRVDSFILRTPV